MNNSTTNARNYLLVYLFALGSALLTVIANRSGVGWSWDTSDYVAVGKNFADGNGLLDATGTTMTVRPPGLSLLIGVGDLLGLSVNLTVQILNALCAMVTVLGTFHLLQIATVKRSVALASTAFVAFSPALLWQYSMIWSEPPFIALVIVTMIVCLRRMDPMKFALLLSLYIALFLVRYVGPVFSVAIAICSVWFDRRQLGVIKSGLVNLLTVAASLVPVWLWLKRNQGIDGTLTGARTPGGGSLLNPLKTFTATIGSWLTASPIEGGIYLSANDYPDTTTIIGLLFLVGLLGMFFVYVRFQSRDNQVLETSNVLLLSGGVSLVYVAFSAYRFVHFELGPLDNRMMIPIYAPLVLVAAILVDGIKVAPKYLRTASLALFSVFILYQAVSSTTDALTFGRDGRHWAARDFQDQPIHQFIRSLPNNSSLMSNQPQLVFAVRQESSVFNQYQLDLAQTAECDRRYFVWINSTYDDGTPNVEGQPVNAATVFADQSGAIFDLGECTTAVNQYWP